MSHKPLGLLSRLTLLGHRPGSSQVWRRLPAVRLVMLAARSSSGSARDTVSYTSELRVLDPRSAEPARAYRVLAPDGQLVGQLPAELDAEKQVAMYRSMVRLQTLDQVMFESQRQGRISFYMTGFGEEAAQVGSARALESQDWVYAQYREAGVLLERGARLDELLNQCFGNELDAGKGRQMPIHYGSPRLNYVTLSSPLATQMPQAAGAAYALRNGPGARAAPEATAVVVCYFGEGAASEGDAHAAMNFAGTLRCPVLFFCRNNQYAISTPASEQYAGDGIVSRASGYGMSAIRVDGNDLFAVFAATRAARAHCAGAGAPALLEAMTYRLGHHSTSDDSSAYRPAAELAGWSEREHPLSRVRLYLTQAGLWSAQLEEEARQEARRRVLEALARAERLKLPPVDSMFDDVYLEAPAHLESQRRQLKQHLSVYGANYPLDRHQEPARS